MWFSHNVIEPLLEPQCGAFLFQSFSVRNVVGKGMVVTYVVIAYKDSN